MLIVRPDAQLGDPVVWFNAQVELAKPKHLAPRRIWRSPVAVGLVSLLALVGLAALTGHVLADEVAHQVVHIKDYLGTVQNAAY